LASWSGGAAARVLKTYRLAGGAHLDSCSTASQHHQDQNDHHRERAAARWPGNWGIKAGATGVCQVLSRYSYLATLSHLRRVSTSIDKNSKLIQPRKLHGSQFGVFCPAETKASQLES
jgi:DNA-directed RNA polymerase beta subunit